MLQQLDEQREAKPALLTPTLTCRKCCRPEYHFAVYKHRWWGLLLVAATLGLILLVGPYRCTCCGTRRLLRFNLLPAMNRRKKQMWNPMDSVSQYRDSWVFAKWKRNTAKAFSKVFGRKKSYRQSKFKKKTW